MDDPNTLTVRCTFDPIGNGGFRGTCLIPLHGPLRSGNSMLAAQTIAGDPVEAQHKVSTIMKQALTSPVLQAMMPPGAPLAIELATQLMHGVRMGDVAHVANTLAQAPDHMKAALHSMVQSLAPHLPHLELHKIHLPRWL